jgi:DNA-binding NarL/FixJ family response regulator
VRRPDPLAWATVEIHVKLRVFVVEDLHNVRVLLNDLLASRGAFEVVGFATTEAEANLWLEENRERWDLLIADLILAQGSGISVVRRAVQSTKSGKVVVLSGYATEGIRRHLLELGVNRVFDKADTEEFVRWLNDTGGIASADLAR